MTDRVRGMAQLTVHTKKVPTFTLRSHEGVMGSHPSFTALKMEVVGRHGEITEVTVILPSGVGMADIVKALTKAQGQK